MWRFSDAELNCVRTKIRRMSACRQLLIGMSISRYWPPIGTAGFERCWVSGNRRDPCPPPRMMATTSLLTGIGSANGTPSLSDVYATLIQGYAVVVTPRPSWTVAYLGAVAAVFLATIGTFTIHSWIEPSISLLFFPAVMVPSMYGGYGPGFLATVLSTIVLAYFFVAPVRTLAIGIDDFVRLA